MLPRSSGSFQASDSRLAPADSLSIVPRGVTEGEGPLNTGLFTAAAGSPPRSRILLPRAQPVINTIICWWRWSRMSGCSALRLLVPSRAALALRRCKMINNGSPNHGAVRDKTLRLARSDVAENQHLHLVG